MNNNIWVVTNTLEIQSNENKNWSEEDEYQINTILHGLDLKRELYKKEGNKVEEDRYNTQYNWLKSLKDRVKPQPKQEWSEEDEKFLNYAISLTDDAQIKNFLKSLKPQPKQELSEKEARYEIHLYQYIGNNGDVDEENANHIYEDDLYRALSIAARYYRHTKNPLVNIFDNEIGDYIAEWD